MRNSSLSATHLMLFRSVRDVGMLRTLNGQMEWPKNFLTSAMTDCSGRDCYSPLVLNLLPHWPDACRVYTGARGGGLLCIKSSERPYPSTVSGSLPGEELVLYSSS